MTRKHPDDLCNQITTVTLSRRVMLAQEALCARLGLNRSELVRKLILDAHDAQIKDAYQVPETKEDTP